MTGIRQLLIANSTIASLIAARMYPVLLPETPTLPAVTYQVISRVDYYTNDGPIGMVRRRLQIDAWGNDPDTAQSVADAIGTVLDGYIGTLPDGTVVRFVERDGSHNDFDQIARLYRVQTDWLIVANS